MRVGLFGGSFNPAHDGHLHVARTAMNAMRLDRVWFLVSPQNPLKDPAETDAYWRRAASVWALGDHPRFVVSDIERRIGSAYTADTLATLTARWPGVRFVWIMGADSLAGFHRWQNWEDILRLVPVAVIARRGIALKGRLGRAAMRFPGARIDASDAAILPECDPPAWTYLTAPLHPQASREIRARAARP